MSPKVNGKWTRRTGKPKDKNPRLLILKAVASHARTPYEMYRDAGVKLSTATIDSPKMVKEGLLTMRKVPDERRARMYKVFYSITHQGFVELLRNVDLRNLELWDSIKDCQELNNPLLHDMYRSDKYRYLAVRIIELWSMEDHREVPEDVDDHGFNPAYVPFPAVDCRYVVSKLLDYVYYREDKTIKKTIPWALAGGDDFDKWEAEEVKSVREFFKAHKAVVHPVLLELKSERAKEQKAKNKVMEDTLNFLEEGC